MRSHGKVFGLVPYDLRPPSPRRVLRSLWNPRDERFFVPTSFGVGWGVNLRSARRHPFQALLFAALVARVAWREFVSDRRPAETTSLRYGTVFLDIDGTLLYVDLDVDGYVEDLAPYSANDDLTAERVAGPVWGSLRRHIDENIEHRTEEGLAEFRRRNAEKTAEELGVEAPTEVLTQVAQRRISFEPYREAEEVLNELKSMGAKLYAVSNWDILLVEVLEDLGWTRFFDGVVASAVVGVEKPDPGIFEEALRLSGAPRDSVVMVGNDPVTDIRGGSGAGLDTVFVDRRGNARAPEATFVLPDLSGLPAIVRG